MNTIDRIKSLETFIKTCLEEINSIQGKCKHNKRLVKGWGDGGYTICLLCNKSISSWCCPALERTEVIEKIYED